MKYLYMVTTRDAYEFPVAIADSVRELSEMTGIKSHTISISISLGRPYYYKIPVEE